MYVSFEYYSTALPILFIHRLHQFFRLIFFQYLKCLSQFNCIEDQITDSDDCNTMIANREKLKSSQIYYTLENVMHNQRAPMINSEDLKNYIDIQYYIDSQRHRNKANLMKFLFIKPE